MNSEQTVFVIDDDPGARGSVAALVESMGARAAEFPSAEEFLAAYDETKSGCLVVDMRLRGMSGIELLETMSQRPFQPPALIVTAFADVPMTVRAMSLGALTVLQKPYRDQELRDAIGNALIIGNHLRRDEAHMRKRQARMASLTTEEDQVLDLILAGKPNKGIARQLGVGLRTVEGRRHSIMAKLEARSLAELVHVAWETKMLVGRLWQRSNGMPQFSADNPLNGRFPPDR
jgi:two-component system, LuxR family, response regulator FixJ